MRKNTVIIFESTVYPGTTEEVCIPIIEKSSSTKDERFLYWLFSRKN